MGVAAYSAATDPAVQTPASMSPPRFDMRSSWISIMPGRRSHGAAVRSRGASATPGTLVELRHAGAHRNRRLLRRGRGALLPDRVSGGRAAPGSVRSPRSLDAYPLARPVHEVLRTGRLARGRGTDAVLRPQARQRDRKSVV